MMSTPIELNSFQVKAQAKILEVVGDYKRHLVFSAGLMLPIIGQREVFLTGTVEGTNLTIWIYKGDLELKTAQRYLLLEQPDFNDGETMLNYFLHELIKELQEQKSMLQDKES